MSLICPFNPASVRDSGNRTDRRSGTIYRQVSRLCLLFVGLRPRASSARSSADIPAEPGNGSGQLVPNAEMKAERTRTLRQVQKREKPQWPSDGHEVGFPIAIHIGNQYRHTFKSSCGIQVDVDRRLKRSVT